MDAVDGIREMSKWPIDAVEFVADLPSSLPQDIDRASREEMRGIVTESGKLLTVHAPFKGQDITSPFPRRARRSLGNLEAAIDLASDIGAIGVVVHPGRGRIMPGPFLVGRVGFYDRLVGFLHSEVPPRPDNIERNMRIIGRLLERSGVIELYLENLPRMYNRRRFFEVVLGDNDALRICFDYGHSLISDWGWLLEDHFDRLGYVHFHLNSGQSDDHMPIDPRDAGAREFLGFLATRGYGGIVMIEPTINDLEGARDSIDATRSMLEEVSGKMGA